MGEVEHTRPDRMSSVRLATQDQFDAYWQWYKFSNAVYEGSGAPGPMGGLIFLSAPRLITYRALLGAIDGAGDQAHQAIDTLMDELVQTVLAEEVVDLIRWGMVKWEQPHAS